MPDPIVLVLGPVSMQFAAPALAEQESVFTAAVVAAPGVIEIPEIRTGEYRSVHSRPTGAVPETAKLKPRVAVPPGFTTAEEILKVLACAIDPRPTSKSSPAKNKASLL
jgi:hypothetical protein